MPARNESPIVSLRDVSRAFENGTVALSGLTLVVGRGEFLTLLGPSGCGKSTALRLVAGLDEPTSGAVVSPPAQGGDVGFVFQDPTLMPWADVFDNVWLPLRLSGVARRSARQDVEEVLETVGLSDFARAFPRELSGGMRMRVSIARALVTRPALLLMDEPFAALDEITRFRLNDDLLALWEASGRTVIFVTHSVFESVYLSSRVAVMSARPGRIAEDIAIDAPYPRSEAFRTSPAYNDRCREVSAALHRAMAGLETA